MGIRSKKLTPWIAMGAVVALACTHSSAATNSVLASEEAREAYSLGARIGEQIRGGLEDVDATAFSAGISDAMHRNEFSLTREQIEGALASHEVRVIRAAAERFAAMAEANGTEGEAFRTAFAKDPDVVSLESGLLYKVIEEGEGDVAETTQMATIHYTAAKIDGSEFDSSRELGEPVMVDVRHVMPGWSEALSLMRPGAKWQIVVPPELAYGDRGYGPIIEPNSTLVFELEVISAS